MEKKITLTGAPPTTSSIYKYRNAGKFIQGYMSGEGKAKKEEYRYEMMAQKKGLFMTEPFSLVLTFFFKDCRKRDVDNFNKLVLDAGTGTLWEDDSLIDDLHIFKFIDKENPRVELTIKTKQNG